MPLDESQTAKDDRQDALARLREEAAFVRTDLTNKLVALSQKLEAANRQLAADQQEIERLTAEVARLQQENARLLEEQEIFRQMATGHQEATQKLLDQAEESQAKADVAARQARIYLLLMIVFLLVALGAIGFAIYIVLQFA